MIIKTLNSLLLGILNFAFGNFSFPDFGVSTTFNPYLEWFSQFNDSVTSLIAFLIPRPVFLTSIGLFLIIHELDHGIDLLNFIVGHIPVIRVLRIRDNVTTN